MNGHTQDDPAAHWAECGQTLCARIIIHDACSPLDSDIMPLRCEVEASRTHRPIDVVRHYAMKRKPAQPAGVKQKLACTQTRERTRLLDLPESLITSILRCLPTESKCQAERVCSAFREVLSNPAPGSFVWDRVSLEDSVFQKPPVHELNR